MEDIRLSEVSETERLILCDLTYMWNLKQQQHTQLNTDTQDRLVVARLRAGRKGEGDQKV